MLFVHANYAFRGPLELQGNLRDCVDAVEDYRGVDAFHVLNYLVHNWIARTDRDTLVILDTSSRSKLP